MEHMNEAIVQGASDNHSIYEGAKEEETNGGCGRCEERLKEDDHGEEEKGYQGGSARSVSSEQKGHVWILTANMILPF